MRIVSLPDRCRVAVDARLRAAQADKLDDNELATAEGGDRAARRRHALHRALTHDEVKRQLFARAAEIRGSNADNYARIAGFALLQLEGAAPVAASSSEANRRLPRQRHAAPAERAQGRGRAHHAERRHRLQRRGRGARDGDARPVRLDRHPARDADPDPRGAAGPARGDRARPARARADEPAPGPPAGPQPPRSPAPASIAAARALRASRRCAPIRHSPRSTAPWRAQYRGAIARGDPDQSARCWVHPRPLPRLSRPLPD